MSKIGAIGFAMVVEKAAEVLPKSHEVLKLLCFFSVSYPWRVVLQAGLCTPRYKMVTGFHPEKAISK